MAPKAIWAASNRANPAQQRSLELFLATAYILPPEPYRHDAAIIVLGVGDADEALGTQVGCKGRRGFEDLLNATHAQWKQLDAELSYAASWSLFQYLMSSENNQRVMKRMLLEWQQGVVDCADQADRFYPGGLQAMEADWHRWIDKTGSSDIYKTAFKGEGVCKFATRGYELTPATEATLNHHAGTLLARHRTILGLDHKVTLRIRIFGEFDEYARFTTNALVSGWAVKAEDLLRVPGYYSPFSKEIVAQNPRSPESLARTVVFLANHAFLNEVLPHVPRWLSSGSSDFFAEMGENEREALKAAWHNAGRMPDFKGLLSDGAAEWSNERNAEVASWGLFHFLTETEPRRQVLKNVIKNLQASPSAVSSSVAVINKSYPGGVTKLEKDLQAWMGEL